VQGWRSHLALSQMQVRNVTRRVSPQGHRSLPITNYGVSCKFAEPGVTEQPVLYSGTSKVSLVACHAVPGPVSDVYAPYLSW
jgi:hypothetical protein